MSASPAISRLRAAGQTIARVAGIVTWWIDGKADAATDEFAKTIGKAAGVAGVGGVAAWRAPASQLKLCEPWRSTTLQGNALLWKALHPKVREFLFTEETL